MGINKKSFSELLKLHNSQNLECTLHVEDKSVQLRNVKLFNSSAPLRKPTTRGGVYFSDVNIFKIKGTIDDFSLVEFLSKTMLGPNPEFKELKILGRATNNGIEKHFLIITNLTNSIQNSSCIELNMVIVRIQEEQN